MSAILETRDLAKTFGASRGWFSGRAGGGVRAVDGVTLAIEAGETFAIVGESGCGKSTLARLLIRLIDPSEGTIRYRGQDIAALPAGEMRRLRKDLQFVFQDPFSSLNPRMSVGRIVGEPMETHETLLPAARRARVAALLRRVGLRPEHADRYPHEFSGGQRQRIGIARALASGPTLLVADEPVSALDLSIQAQVINLLQDLKSEFGLTLVIISHDLAVIRHMSDRVGVMYLGQMVEVSPAEALFSAPLHPYTQALLAAIPEPRAAAGRRAKALKGEMPNPASPPPGCRFHTRCPFARPRCATEVPSARPAGDGRSVACHFWREIQASGQGYRPPEAPALRPEVARRFALFRAGTEGAATDPTPSPTEERRHAHG
jgi:oligopeptide/dipeptide ABC transporter ATP-binding protein